MASGTLENLAHSAFVPTRLADAERICYNLLGLPAAPYTVLDPTSGEGHLLVPFAANPRAQLYGVELSAERAAESRARLPRAMIVSSPFENVRIADNTVDLVVSNPPYMIGELGRLEYAIIRDITAALRPGNPHITIVPARQWDGTMARFWARHYERVQCWMLEADEFAKYTQIVVAGVKRNVPLTSPDPLELNRIRGFRYRLDPEHLDRSPWAQGFAPAVLPGAPIADPYIVTPGGEPVEITVLKADQAELLRGLDKGGAHLTPAWQSATSWQAAAALERPLMPISGESYLAALILTGTLDGEELEGPDGQTVPTSDTPERWTWSAGRAIVLYEWSWFDPDLGKVVGGWSQQSEADDRHLTPCHPVPIETTTPAEQLCRRRCLRANTLRNLASAAAYDRSPHGHAILNAKAALHSKRGRLSAYLEFCA